MPAGPRTPPAGEHFLHDMLAWNDVLIGGQRVGILVEARPGGGRVIVGIGVNANRAAKRLPDGPSTAVIEREIAVRRWKMAGSSFEAMPSHREPRVRHLILAALFAALTAVGAQIQVPLPFSPVPIVLSNFFAILSGLILGVRLGTTSQVVYLLLGAVGAPVFAGMHGGPQVLVGPTSGYLIGFVLASATAGAVSGPYPNARRTVIAAAVASAVIYLPGILYLAASTGMGLRRALFVGLLPFLPGDTAKVVIAGLIAPALQRVVRASSS